MKFFKIVFILLILAMSGCATLNQFVQEPLVAFNSVDIQNISIRGVDLLVRVDVENLNRFTVPLPNIDWKLSVNTAEFLKGALPSSSRISGGRKTTMEFPLSLTYEGIFKTFASLIETKEVNYEIDLAVNFPIPIIDQKVFKFNFAGNFPLPQLPKLKPGSIKISKLDFTGLELACDINIENPNSFPLPFPDLSYNYEVSNVPLVRSSLTKNGEIAAGAAGIATIALGVAFADVIKAAGAAAVNRGEAPTKLSMTAPSSIPALSGLKNALDIPGTIPVLSMPEVSFQGITKKAGNILSPTQEFILTWEVDNKNTFAMNIAEFIYDFKVNNSNWAKGTIGNPPKVKAQGKTAIPLTISVSTVAIGTEVINLIFSNNPVVNFGCIGNMGLLPEIPNFPLVDKLNIPLNLQGSTKIK